MQLKNTALYFWIIKSSSKVKTNYRFKICNHDTLIGRDFFKKKVNYAKECIYLASLFP